MKHARLKLFGPAALGVSILWLTGCGSSDTRPVNAPPPSAKPAGASVPGGMTTTPPPAPVGRTAAAEKIGPGWFRTDLLDSKKDIDAALAALAELTAPATTDLSPPFNRYSDSLSRLETRSEKMRKDADAMRKSQSEYFAQWEEKVSDIDSATVRGSAEARRSRLRSAQERLTNKSAAVRDSYEPFMRDMQDVRKFLVGDLSKQSVALVEDAAKKTHASGQTVKQKIDDLIAEIDSIDPAPATRPATNPAGETPPY